MTEENDLPAEVALLWGLRDTARRGRKPSLTVADITRAAVEVADADGIGAVSMAKVAERLGNATMALYRHVKSKNDLLLLMADAAIGPAPALPEGLEWRAALTVWVRGVLDALREHPWVVHLPISGPPVGPNNLSWFDRALGALGDSGLSEDSKVGVVMGLLTYVQGEARLSTDLAAGYQENPEAFGRQYGRALAAVVDPERFPALSKLVASGVFDADVPYDEEVDGLFGLNLYLDGVAALIERTTR
ncbi:TetR/AcrR family transcriptional regulator [Umezawaea sp.]|uniref:TetR/AcrR family transcriptional regulator n=1 Tax=Umezawaea sp. TaxID=1955258 RepID=UPI002ED0CCEC